MANYYLPISYMNRQNGFDIHGNCPRTTASACVVTFPRERALNFPCAVRSVFRVLCMAFAEDSTQI